MITRLTVTNFRAIRGTKDYDNLPPGVIAFVGLNEAGKSSSLLAIAYACYGGQAMPEGIDVADLINDHAKELSVTIHFDHNGDSYVLTRSQRRDGRGDATLTRNGEPLATGRAPVTKAITELFGVDHVGFMVGVFARQDELDALAGKKGAERVTTMLRLLGVYQAEAAVKSIRKEANEERRALELLRAGTIDVAALKEQKGAVEADLVTLRGEWQLDVGEVVDRTKAIDGLRIDLAELAPQREAFAAWQTKRTEANSALSTAKARSDDAQKRITVLPADEPTPPVLDEVEDVDDAVVEAAEEAYAQQRERFSAAEGALKSLREEIDGLTDSCAACGRAFDNAEQVAEHRVALGARILAAESELEEIRENGRTARAAKDDLVARRGRATLARTGNERKQAAYDLAVRDRAAAAERNATAEAEAERLQLEWQEARFAITILDDECPPDPSEQEERLTDAISDERTLISDAEVRVATAEAGITAAQANLDRIEADLNRAAQRSDEIAALESRVVTLDVAAKEMVAMKERLIGRIIPALEERASAIVNDLTDGKHSELHLTPDYEIQYRTGTGALRSFANLSGGAQDVFALALRLAIAELRAGSVSFLVLDEVFESLDDERQGLAWEAIERLGKRYEQVLVVTHVAALRERAANVIAV